MSGSTNYPAGVDNFPQDRTTSDTVQASDHNDLAAAVMAIQVELGIDPSGTYPNLASRLTGEGYPA